MIGEAQVPANTLLGLLEATGGVVAGAVGVGAATALVHVAEGSALGAGGDIGAVGVGALGVGSVLTTSPLLPPSPSSSSSG